MGLGSVGKSTYGMGVVAIDVCVQWGGQSFTILVRTYQLNYPLSVFHTYAPLFMGVSLKFMFVACFVSLHNASRLPLGEMVTI